MGLFMKRKNLTGIVLIVSLLLNLFILPGPSSVYAADGPTDDEPEQGSTPYAYIKGGTFDERSDALIQYLSKSLPSQPTKPKYAMAYHVSRLLMGVDTDYAKAQIESILDKHDINDEYAFSIHAVMNGYLIGKEKYTPVLTNKTKAYLAKWDYSKPLAYTAANYELMTYGAGYLAAEEWPDFVDAGGNNAQKIKEVTLPYIEKYLNSIPAKNIAEHGPVYYEIDIHAVKMIADFAQNTELRRKASMVVDWMMTSLAGDWNQGYLTGTSDRAKNLSGTVTSPDAPEATAAAGWLYFGGRRGINAAETMAYHTFFIAYKGKYTMPNILYYMANDRSTPIVKKESMLEDGRDVRRYTYHSSNYGLASQYDFTANPYDYIYKEGRRTTLKWVSDKPFSTFVPMQDNRFRPSDKYPNVLGYGENPFQQVMQHERTLIGVYNVSDPNYGFSTMYVPFSKSGSIVKRIESDGWIFRHTGSMMFAFKPIKSFTWDTQPIDYDIVWSDQLKNGWILETTELTPYATGNVDSELEAFKNDILSKASIDASAIDAVNPRLTYKSIYGYTLDLTYRPHAATYVGQNKLNGVPVNYSAYPMIDMPWAHQDVGSPVLNLQYNGYGLTYNFADWTVTETGTALPEPQPVNMPIVIPSAAPKNPAPLPKPSGTPWYIDDFESGNVESWTPVSGSWAPAVDGTYTYRQSNASASNALSSSGSPLLTDVDLEVKVKPLSFNGNDRAVTIAARYTDANNMYFVQLKNSNKLELRRKVLGASDLLASTEYPITAGTTYTVRMIVLGHTISVYINGKLQLTGTDTGLASGKIALGTSYTDAEFDNLILYDLSSNPVPQPPQQESYTTLTLDAEADTYVQPGSTNGSKNFGTATTMIVKNDTNNAGGNTRMAFVRFPLNNPGNNNIKNYLDQGAQIQSAKLLLTTVKVGATPSIQTLGLLNNDTWDENQITWNNTVTGFTYSPIKTFAGPLSGGQAIEIDITPQVLNKVLGNGKISFKILSNTDNATANVEYGTKENTTATNRPKLVVTLVPPAIKGGLPSGTVNNNYGNKLLTSNLSPSVTWSVYRGALPPGLTLSNQADSVTGNVYGSLSGSPTIPGIYSFTLQATNGTVSAIKSFTVPVYKPLITTEALFDAHEGRQSALDVTVSPSGPSVTAITNGTTPLVLDQDYAVDPLFNYMYTISDNYLKGLDVRPEPYPIIFHFSDGTTANVNVYMIDSLQITTTSLPSGKVSQPYPDSTIASNLSPIVTWSISSGMLPPGLSLRSFTDNVSGNVYGQVYGVPGKAGSYTFTLKADNVRDHAEKSFTVTITPADSIITTELATFDKNSSKQTDIAIQMITNGNTLLNVFKDSTPLVRDRDYTVSEDQVVIKKQFLSSLNTGVSSFSFDFDYGTDPQLTLTIVDTSPVISPIKVDYDKGNKKGTKLEVSIPANAGHLLSITNGSSVLKQKSDYKLIGNTVKIKKRFLNKLPLGQTQLTFHFDTGTAPVLTINVTKSQGNKDAKDKDKKDKDKDKNKDKDKVKDKEEKIKDKNQADKDKDK
ncbi:X2-like carbohydrate binding domain-containing protein [Paenibacillus sp. RC67]|uniref:X2-like carbohydrate binding domain-containing protein n=1 Tax=Paenibacillus sp. RC67 TaxID=3039392 RepID=UPI0024AD7167|nr:X2-like carbohydrate binding domain-containing protein [Paenibacillus sp. RC67]